ncbi:DUF1329 domain-containing protein [Marinobacterium sediminicola]|uniref:Sigma E regulatory protein, MucB/RseB n=1 Tax=Marinobacterium sediminicola TaxID=518898 RepID=A0ABY1S4K7_9GAMM|nr:DUF1329 domain-containing protein [Marinobacterium sediminicola]ULG70135.1 DUF1329 domain-containing protein [Marinobacterium sediminicola]SMR78410.1 Protein of unknown function [Marinobacterium sediminicola]
MRKQQLWKPLAASIALALSASAYASVTPQEASKLGNELTCMGGIAAGNEAGTIPAFSGKWLGTPPGIEYTPNVGQHPIDPYPEDKPQFQITGQNWEQYKDNLTEGQIALFKRFPDTFRIPVYQGRRDFRYPDNVCEVAKKNAVEAQLVDGGMGFKGYMGPVPFPIPSGENQAMQVLANHNYPYRAFTEVMEQRDLADVNTSGEITWGRTFNSTLNVITLPDLIGKPIGDIMAYSDTGTLLPTRDKGKRTVSIEPMNFAQGQRLAWTYNPGTRRVRQLPEYGFDTPAAGTSGKMTIDQDRLMNGSPERYNWELKGKREIYVPANAYRIHEEGVSYDQLLTPNHANPDLMRYELRRVWVLEGTLKETHRHKYGKRVLFIDEDTWHGVMSDYYDTRGELVNHALLNYYYAYDMSAWHAGTSFYHDLTTGGYVAYNLFQDLEKGPILNAGGLDPEDFTPAALRRRAH